MLWSYSCIMVKFTRDGHNGCIQRNSRAKMVIWGNVGSAVGVAGNEKYDGKLKKCWCWWELPCRCWAWPPRQQVPHSSEGQSPLKFLRRENDIRNDSALEWWWSDDDLTWEPVDPPWKCCTVVVLVALLILMWHLVDILHCLIKNISAQITFNDLPSSLFSIFFFLSLSFICVCAICTSSVAAGQEQDNDTLFR